MENPFENAALAMFSQAVRSGSASELREIEMWLERHDVNPGCMNKLAQRKNSRGETPLLIATKANHLEVAKCLVERYQVDVNQRTELWWNLEGHEQCEATAIHAAVILGHEDMVQYLAVDCKANVNVKTKTLFSNSEEFGGNTPLHLAVLCLEGTVQENIIRCLILHGSNMATTNNAGNPCWALTFNVDVIKMLIGLGIDTDPSTCRPFETLAHDWANSLDPRSIEIFQLLVEKGVFIHKADDEGKTPLMVAAIGSDGRPNLDVFQFILNQEAQPVYRQHKIDALELLGSTYVNNMDFNMMDFGLIYWRNAMDLRFNSPDEPPLPKPDLEFTPGIAKAVKDAREVKTLEELEDLINFNDPDALRVQSILTYLRILGAESSDTWNAITSYALDCWCFNDCENFINYSMLVLECTQSLNDPLWNETINTISRLILGFYALLKEDAQDGELVNFLNVMPVVHCVAKELESADEYYWIQDEDIDFLLDCVIQLAILVSSMKLTPEEDFEYKKRLFQIVRKDKRCSRNGSSLLLLACSDCSYAFSIEELGDFSQLPNAAVIRLLIEVGADPNAVDDFGNTGLHILAQNGESFHSPTVRALFEGGAHLDQANNNRETMADILHRDAPRQENTIIVNPLLFPSLKCLSAGAVRRTSLPFYDVIPTSLVDFTLKH